MKKLFALALVAVMLIPAIVYSCDGTGAAVLPAVNSSTDLCGEVYAAVQASTGCLFGMLSPTEKVSVYPAQTDAGRVRGITAKGINRAKGEMRYMTADGAVLGLTKVKASVHISAEYLEIVTGIVRRDLGEDAELTAAGVVACTLRRTACTVTHRMVGRTAGKIAVGSVLFCGAEMSATIYIADWDLDGQMDLVLSVNPGPGKTAAPTATPKPSKPKPKTTQKPDCTKVCIKIVNMIQINICGFGERIQQIVNCPEGKRGC